MQEISHQEFNQLTCFIKQSYGIDLSKKKTLVQGRLDHYILQSGFTSFTEYFSHVKQDSTGKASIDLVNKLTTNHTYFLREFQHFKFLMKVVLPYLGEKEKGEKDLRVWSAGCSTGEEPYTLAMMMDSYFGTGKKQWDTKILATDISTDVLAKARKGMYPNEQLTMFPEDWRTKYFKKISTESSVVVENIKKEVIFRRFNLMNKIFPFKKKFHLILCRNVMIYFDIQTKEELINRFYDYMEPGGYLFIGHSESIDRSGSRYQFIAPAVYRKE